MTAAAPAAARAAAGAPSRGDPLPDSVAWPAPDTAVLRARPLRTGADPAGLPRFADATWHLQAAHPDVHAVAATLRWDRFPEPLTAAFKAFALAALDHPYPVDPTVGRRGERPAVTTLALWVRDLRVFARWLHERGITRLCRSPPATCTPTVATSPRWPARPSAREACWPRCAPCGPTAPTSPSPRG